MRDDGSSERLDRLWEAYRQATPAPEPSANFMPHLWARIDAARPGSWTVPLARLAARLVPLAAAATLAMGAYIWSPRPMSNATLATSGYVDMLAADLLDDQRPTLFLGTAEESF
jgi:hypothetical protein